MQLKSISLSTVFVVLFLLLNSFQTRAQEGYPEIPRHEINYNIINTFIVESFEFGYEYFIDYDQSIGVKALINDRRNLRHQRSGDKYSTHAIQVNYSYYFGDENPGSGIYIQPFVKYRFGDFKENRETSDYRKIDMGTFILGLGTGYNWNLSNSFVFGPFVDLGRGFSSKVKERFSAFEFNAGFNLGYRF